VQASRRPGAAGQALHDAKSAIIHEAGVCKLCLTGQQGYGGRQRGRARLRAAGAHPRCKLHIIDRGLRLAAAGGPWAREGGAGAGQVGLGAQQAAVGGEEALGVEAAGPHHDRRPRPGGGALLLQASARLGRETWGLASAQGRHGELHREGAVQGREGVPGGEGGSAAGCCSNLQ
jgi:hypothetical protein